MKKITVLLLSIWLSVSLALPSLAMAAPTNSNPLNPGGSGPTSDIAKEATGLGFFDTDKDIGFYITRLVDFILIFGAMATLIYLLWGGVEWITSGGDSQKYESARNKMTSAVVGLAVLASVFVIWQISLYFLGFQEIDQLETPELVDSPAAAP